jgi:hypothetical protein
MNRFNWFAHTSISQVLKIQLPNDFKYENLFDSIFLKFTKESDLISIDSIRSDKYTELIYNIVPKKKINNEELISEIKKLNGSNKVTLITGYDNINL